MRLRGRINPSTFPASQPPQIPLPQPQSRHCIGAVTVQASNPVYNQGVTKRVIHISEAEAAGDFASLMARVRSGTEVVIEDNERPVAIVRPVAEPSLRLLSESLRLAREHGSTVTLDGDFGRDLEEIINSHREPLSPPAWD